MSISIEGFIPQIPNQEKNSVPSTETPLYTGGRLSRRGGRGSRFQNYLLAGLTLSSPLIAACGTTARVGDSPTVPEATATAFSEQNPDASTVNIPGVGRVGLEPVPQSEPPRSPEEKVTDARKAQQEALAKGENRIGIPEEISMVGGNVKDKYVPETSAGILYMVVPPKKEISFPSLVDGTVVEARRTNFSTNTIKIEAGNIVWRFTFPRNGVLSVEKGQLVNLGSILSTVTYDPDDEIQRSFESDGVGTPAGTVAWIAAENKSTREYLKLSADGSVLKDSKGNYIPVPTAPSSGKG